MQLTTVVLALAATAAAADSCAKSYASKFGISVVKPQGSSKRDLSKRAACDTGEGALVMSLKDGILTDAKDRTGYIASNFQFQFDGPPQADHLEVSGFEVCGNNSLALNGNAVWYQCLSGNFYNLYNKNWAAQCKPVEIQAVACDGSASGSGSAGSSGSGSAGSTGSAAPAPAAASPTPAAGASQISDGQPQAPSATIAVGAAAAYGPQVILAAAGLAAAAML